MLYRNVNITVEYLPHNKLFKGKVGNEEKTSFYAKTADEFEQKYKEMIKAMKQESKPEKAQSKQIRATNIETGEEFIFGSRKELKDKLFLEHHAISNCLNKIQNSTKGYILSYMDNNS